MHRDTGFVVTGEWGGVVRERSPKYGEQVGVRRSVSKGIHRKRSEYVLFQTKTTRGLNPNVIGTLVRIPLLIRRAAFITPPRLTLNTTTHSSRGRAAFHRWKDSHRPHIFPKDAAK